MAMQIGTYIGTDREDAVHLIVSWNQRENIPSTHVSVYQFLFTVINCDVCESLLSNEDAAETFISN